jgi:AcrR family transcriptional regulator
VTALPDPSDDHPRWQRRPDARPREILEAAVAVFADAGFERATLADVARRAGVSPALVVHYYRSKAGLFEAVIRDRMLQFVAGEEALLAGHRGSYRELLHALLHRLWQHCWERHQMELMLVVKGERGEFPECTRALFQELGDRWRRLLQGVLEAGARQGEFRPLSPPVARVVASMVIGTAESARCFGSFDPRPATPDELWSAIASLLDHGVLTAPAPAGPQGESQ